MYIPTEEERTKVYAKINALLKPKSIETGQQMICQQTKISKQDLDCLVARLTKDTKRECLIKNQIDLLKQVNVTKKIIAKNEQKVEVRLMRAGQEIEIKKEKLREEEIKRQEEELQQIPTISQRAKSAIRKPFMERIEDAIYEKENILKSLSSKYEPEFKPKLNTYSLFMAEVQNSKNFIGRLEEDKEARKESEKEKVKEKFEKEMEGVTFQPQINKKSRYLSILNNSSEPQKETKKISKKDQVTSFRPSIDKRSEKMVARSRANSNLEFHDRLYEDMKKIQQKKQSLKTELESLHSYKPKISERSIRILSEKMKRMQNKKIEGQDEISEEEIEEIFYNNNPLFPDEREPTGDMEFFEGEEHFDSLYEEVEFHEDKENKPNNINREVIKSSRVTSCSQNPHKSKCY